MRYVWIMRIAGETVETRVDMAFTPRRYEHIYIEPHEYRVLDICYMLTEIGEDVASVVMDLEICS